MTNNHYNSTSRNSAGFVQLDDGSHAEMTDYDNGIPLTTVKSNASTGARKRNLAQSNTFNSQNNSEKEHVGHHHHQAGRRRRHGLGRRGTADSDNMPTNALGRLYERVIASSAGIRYLVYIIPVGILLAIPVIILAVTGNQDGVVLGKGGKNNDENGASLFKLLLWLEIAWLTMWAAKLVAWALPKIFMYICGIVSPGVRKYATVLSNMTIVLSLFLWALASWLTFNKLFQHTRSLGIPWAKAIEQILGALFASSAVLLGEKTIVQLISVSYHQRSFANRIRASKREIHLLGLLYDASRTLFPMYCREFAGEDYVINDSIEMMLLRKKGHKKNGASTPMRLIGDVGRFGDKVTSAFGNIASEITGKQVFNPNSAHSIVLEALEKPRSSEALARRVWMSFVLEGKDALYLEDFEEVLGPAYKEEAEEAFNFVDDDLNGDISLDEMIRKVVEMGKERRAISEGMKDIGQALEVFDKVLLFVVLLISIFIFLAFFKSKFITVVATAGTALLSLSFVFAVTTQEFLGSCIFLFVKHPYDVGDRVDISGIKMTVDRISLLYTVFTRIDQMQVVQVPNIQLNNLWIDNISRSKAMMECFELNVSFDTSFEDIELLRVEMEKFVRSPENSRDFQHDFTISVGGVNDLTKMTLLVCIKHKSNWHNDGVRATRRSKFMCALAVALKKIPINGPGGGSETLGGPTNPTYSVSVTDDFAALSRDKASKDKDAARMVPSATNQTEEEIKAAEQHAILEINNRNVAADATGNWDGRDDMTINSRDHSEDPRRSKDIESIRTELIKRETSRGRRRVGDTVPTLSPISNSGHAFPQHPISPRLETFDEEAQTGVPSNYYSVNLEEADEGALQPVQSATSNIGRSNQGSMYRGPSPRTQR